jgi:aminoacylase
MASGGADTSEDVAVTNFRRYLRINTEHPHPDYESCKKFLFEYGKELGLEVWAHDCVPGKPMVGMTLVGTDPSLPSLHLYSHTDVVPTFRESWKNDPYSAYKDADGNIFARGAQDMKCVGIQYTEALRRLKEGGNAKFLRTVHILWGPEEELGGTLGMGKFVETEKFKNLNIGFSLDEGLANPSDAYKVYYGERCVWWLKVSCKGFPGHGSRFIENNAGAKLQAVINSFLGFREEQRKKLEGDKNLTLGDVISVNLTKVEGGVQMNVLPPEFAAYFDMRVPPSTDFDKLEAQIGEWCKQAGPDVTYEFLHHVRVKNVTPTTKEDPWWNAFSSVLEEEHCKIEKEIFIGATDSRYLRERGFKSIGFSPMNNTPTLLHDHNEYLNEKVFLRGVELYAKLIPRLANVPQH